MRRIVVGNICFEMELANAQMQKVDHLTKIHPNFLQLQYLPLLYADKNDTVLVTDFPPDEYLFYLEDLGFSLPHITTYDEASFEKYDQLSCWGWSPDVISRMPHVKAPTIPSIAKLTSKEFSHHLSPLADSTLAYDETQLSLFLTHHEKCLVKFLYGFSGRGHIPLHAEKKWVEKCQTEWNLNRPVLVEEHKMRLFDFSSHWVIEEQNLHYLSSSRCVNTDLGTYVGNLAGYEQEVFGEYLPFFKQHMHFIRAHAKSIVETGYFGPISFDAMVYEEDGIKLQPIVEINPRYTMGWVANALFAKFGKGKVLDLRYEKIRPDEKGLLPNFIQRDKKVTFNKQLYAITF